MTNEDLQNLLRQAVVAEAQGNYDEAERLSQEILASLSSPELAEQTDTERTTLQIGATRMLGVVCWRRGDYPQALEHLYTALYSMEQKSDQADKGGTLSDIGHVHYHVSDYPKALEYYGKALGIAEEIGNKTGAGACLTSIGNVHAVLSDYTKALEYYAKALGILEELSNKAGVGACLGNIGGVHSLLSDYPKALEYYGKALSIAEELGQKNGVATYLGNIGNVHAKRCDYPKALEYHGKALCLAEEIGDKRGVAIVLGNIGTAYAEQQSYQRAQEHYLKALQISEEIGASWPRLHWLQALGSLYAKQKQLSTDANEAEKFLLLAITDSTTQGVKHITRDASEACYLLYKEQERWQEALSMKELHESLKEQIDIEETKKQESIRQHKKQIELAQATASAKLTATTSLLHRVLPAEIATRMMSGEEEIADYFTSVSILFADIAGFTPISADMPAIIVVRFLNYVFAEFDRIIKKHGCEKIKTIGDGYMAVCGAPLECADHAERLAAAALEMQETISLPESIREHMPQGIKLGIRIGLHTGSVVAGVIGEERFVYDIYSDAVNTAARMESHGEENRIHCSNDFYRHLQNRIAMTKNTAHGFVFEKRGEMEIKGKGTMRTYFLEKA